MALFLGMNACFIGLFIYLAIASTSWIGWTAFIVGWCVADYFVIKKTNIHLTKKQWMYLLLVLTAIDFAVMYGTGKLDSFF